MNVKPLKPEWLRVKGNSGKQNTEVMDMLRELNLHTVCEEAGCPNCGECFGRKTATFMVLGKNCTRNCTFCTVSKGKPTEIDKNEPKHIAEAAKKLGLKHIVITSVTRDDLFDGGAGHFADIIHAIKDAFKANTPVIEVLIPDFKGDKDALKTVINAKPDIINHNIETVPRLYPEVRPMAIYSRSLDLLKRVKSEDSSIYTKSGIMVGLGEGFEEVLEALHDLRQAGCEVLTIGQYLAPSPQHHPIVDYVHPDIFERYKTEAEKMGFLYVASAPLVRSSYLAEKAYDFIVNKKI